MAGEIALHAEQGEDKLLEIRPFVLAEPVGDMDGVAGSRLVLTPHADGGRILVHHRCVNAEVPECLQADLGEDLPGAVCVDAVQHPADGVVDEKSCGHSLSEEERHITATEEFFHPVER